MNAPNEPHLFFICPDTNIPTGGIMMIYRHVDHLNAAGVQATVLHSQPGFRCTWFENATPVDYAISAKITMRDLIVIPEIYGMHADAISQGLPFAIFNQNCHFTFLGWGWPHNEHDASNTYNSNNLLGVVTVSQHNHEYVAWAFPDIPVERITYGITTGIDSVPKEDLIAFMPRKNADQAEQVLNILAARGALDGFQTIPLDGIPHDKVIEILRRARVFLSFGYPEGNGLPLLEALSAGCITVGYDGYGGGADLTSKTGFPVRYGDILEFAKTAESVLSSIRDDPNQHLSIIEAGKTRVNDYHSMAAERDSVVAAWRSIVARHPGTQKDLTGSREETRITTIRIPGLPGN